MTATASPKELLTDHRTNKRLAATLQNAPLDRSAFPGLGLESTGMIYLRGKVPVYHPMHGTPENLGPDKLALLLTSPDTSTVVADTYTFSKLTVMADNMPSNDFKALSRRLKISRGLPGSVKLPVLTEALATRYWMQDGLADNSFDDWAEAFGVQGQKLPATMRALILLASAGKRLNGLGYEKQIKGLESLEMRLMEQCKWSGISTDCYVYDMLESYNSKANGLRVVDPGLLEMHAMDGQSCRIVPMNVTTVNFTASVSSPFKLKEGRGVRLTDGISTATTKLDSLRFGGGTLHAVFDLPSVRSGGRDMIKAAKAGHAKLYAVEDVFESRGAALKNKRWLGGDVERIGGREVPLDIALAGAPTEG